MAETKTPRNSLTARLARIGAAPEGWLLLALLIAQASMFGAAVSLRWGSWLVGDNTFYETPAWNLVEGHGLSIARDEWEDPYLTGRYHAAHPSAAGSRYVPAVTLPPGYSMLLAGIYAAAGRSPLAAVLANGLLLLAALAAMWGIARRAFGKRAEAGIALLLLISFPNWAAWAAYVMSDTLHVLLITLFALVWLRDAPSLRRTFLAGLLLGLASLVRPYSLLLPVAFAAARPVFRLPAFRLRTVAVLAAVSWTIMGGWVARNYYYFGPPPMVSSMQLGDSMWMGTYEVGVPQSEVAEAYSTVGDLHLVAENERLGSLALERIREAPARYAVSCLVRAGKIWTGLAWGPAALAVKTLMDGGHPVAARLVKVGFGAFYVLLLSTMVAGAYLLRRTRDPILAGAIVLTVYYTVVFLPLHTEARYTLPARFFGLLLSSHAIARALRSRALQGTGSDRGSQSE